MFLPWLAITVPTLKYIVVISIIVITIPNKYLIKIQALHVWAELYPWGLLTTNLFLLPNFFANFHGKKRVKISVFKVMCWKQLTTDWLTVMSARYSLIDGSEIHFTDLELYKFNKRFYAWHLQLRVLPSATFVLWTALLHCLFIVLHKVSLLHADRGIWRGTSNGTLKDVSKWSK